MSIHRHVRLFVISFVCFYANVSECKLPPTGMGNGNAKGNTAITCYLYKKPLPGTRVELFTGDAIGLQQSGYNTSLKTLLVTHGWLSSIESPSVSQIANASLEFLDVNFIAVDWSNYSMTNNYLEALAKVPSTGEDVSYFVDFLIRQGTTPKHTHIIGHSLGAHVAGFAGKGVKKLGHTVGRITGLDAALPLISIKPSMRLSKEDAKFVDCIHTDGGVAGFIVPLGTADYYPNGGGPMQPGCNDEHPNACSHARAPAFFSESINPTHHFKAKKCSVVFQGVPINCAKKATAEMGYYASPNDQGSFYLKTNAESPFARSITE